MYTYILTGLVKSVGMGLFTFSDAWFDEFRLEVFALFDGIHDLIHDVFRGVVVINGQRGFDGYF
jgi:hypothetical protein